MKAFAGIVATTSLVALSAPAYAQFAKVEDAIKYRQSALFVMGQHFGRLGAMVNGRTPFDPKVAADNAEVVAALAKLPWSAFGPGTDMDGNTKARPEIWTEPAKFKANSDKMIAETAKLAASTKTGTLASLKTSFAATAETCKVCHDAFREK